MTQAYRQTGVSLPATTHVASAPAGSDWSRALILAPMSARGTVWTRRFGAVSTGMASGWMRIRGTRRRRAIDRGFVLSDHADWPGLQHAIHETGAEKVGVTHGYVGVLTHWLRERGLDARPIATPFHGEDEDEGSAQEREE